MVQELQLNQEEVIFLKKLYKIRKSKGGLFQWFAEMEKKARIGGAPDDLSAQWARKTFEKIKLDKAEKFMFAEDLIEERERVDLNEL